MFFLKTTVKLCSILCFILTACPSAFCEDLCDSFRLQILESKSQKVLFEAPAVPGDTFLLDYIHSSDKTPIQDVFLVERSGTIVLIEERFSWYGAGLEFHEGYRGARAVYDDRGTRMLLRRQMSPFLLRVGRVAQHHITYHGAVLRLRDLAKGGELLEIRVSGQACAGTKGETTPIAGD